MPQPLFAVPPSRLEPVAEPVFCFTTDIEWAPEWAIDEVLSFFAERELPLTPFLTHRSAVFTTRYDRPGMHAQVGLHPNFLPGSSHGKTTDEVVATSFELWPHARGFRSHYFYEDSRSITALARCGMRWDSNLCLFLQPACVPLLHHTGLVRFPVFWEDDVHFGRGLACDFEPLRRYFEGPGLKVINLHPLLFALNVPTPEFYAEHKHLNGNPDPEAGLQARYRGAGSRTFVEQLADHVCARGARARYLDDLYLDLVG